MENKKIQMKKKIQMQYNNSTIYFINEKFVDEEENVYIELIDVSDGNENTSLLINQRDHSYIRFSEGKFVYMVNERFYKAGANSYVKSLVARDVYNRKEILNSYIEPGINSAEDIDNVWSYHINVGCANFSVIVYKQHEKYHIWVVDASVIETRTWINYHRNIEKCFEYISSKFKISKCNLFIEKFMLTHSHYDHFSGFEYLVDQGFINRNTEVWINGYYSWPYPAYSSMLGRITSLGIRCVQPIAGNSTRNVKVLYPNVAVSRTPIAVPHVIEANPNNSSAVYQICLGGKSMVFPGDLETKGWDQFLTCYPNLNNSSFYCISHHGSENGHIGNICLYRTIHNISDCCTNIGTCILMGRDGAYPGMYAASVLSDFGVKIVQTEGNHFLELEWNSGTVSTC